MLKWYIKPGYGAAFVGAIAVLHSGIKVIENNRNEWIAQTDQSVTLAQAPAIQRWVTQAIVVVLGPVDAVSAASDECPDCYDPTPVPTPRKTVTPRPVTPAPAVTSKPVATQTPKPAAGTVTPVAIVSQTPVVPASSTQSSVMPQSSVGQTSGVLGASTTKTSKSWWEDALMAPLAVGVIGAGLVVGGLFRVWRQARMR